MDYILRRRCPKQNVAEEAQGVWCCEDEDDEEDEDEDEGEWGGQDKATAEVAAAAIVRSAFRDHLRPGSRAPGAACARQRTRDAMEGAREGDDGGAKANSRHASDAGTRPALSYWVGRGFHLQ